MISIHLLFWMQLWKVWFAKGTFRTTIPPQKMQPWTLFSILSCYQYLPSKIFSFMYKCFEIILKCLHSLTRWISCPIHHDTATYKCLWHCQTMPQRVHGLPCQNMIAPRYLSKGLYRFPPSPVQASHPSNPRRCKEFNAFSIALFVIFCLFTFKAEWSNSFQRF